mgnify:CR=1 FL=1
MTNFNVRMETRNWRQAPARLGGALLLCACMADASAQGAHRHRTAGDGKTSPVFIASSAKPFAVLMDDAMAVMDHGMKRAPIDGVSEHDFVSMMIPHHQGAIDMAKALLLSTKDPELRNLAQGIITEQQNEIRVMQAWLRRDAAKRAVRK